MQVPIDYEFSVMMRYAVYAALTDPAFVDSWDVIAFIAPLLRHINRDVLIEISGDIHRKMAKEPLERTFSETDLSRWRWLSDAIHKELNRRSDELLKERAL